MIYDGINDESNETMSVEVYEAHRAAREVINGEKSLSEAGRGLTPRVKDRMKEIIAEGKLEADVARELRKARINTLIADDDPEVALKAIKASQTEDGVGGPGTAVQINFTEVPEKVRQLMEEVGDGEN